jgi:aspartyl-tRNA(Asn)/glutamyl-tRNA(Gln) amidotransferase subunit A
MAPIGAAATISELAPLIQRGELSPVDLTKRYLDRVRLLNPALNAYITVAEKHALASGSVD